MIARPAPARLSRAEAIRRARGYVHLRALRAPLRASLVVLPRLHRLAWRVLVPGARPLGDFEALVDARSGALVRLRNLVENATTPALVFDPNPVVEQGSRTGLADNNDTNYPALDPLYRPVTLLDLGTVGCLQGQWVNAIVLPASRCPAGRNFGSVKRSDQCAASTRRWPTSTSTGCSATSRAWASRTSSTARSRSTCTRLSRTTRTTARPPRALNFGDGGVDDAQDADVISHEYGHAIQDSQVPGFGVTTEGGTLGEGFGDYWQAAMSANQGNADIFNTCFAEWDTSAVSDDPLPCLRDVDHPWTVDEAVNECGGHEIHCVGQAWANLLWTIRKQLGGATADRLVVQSQFSYSVESGFRDASLALLFADRQLNGGANRAFLQNLLVARGFLTLDELDDQPSGALPLAFPGDASGAAGVNTDERDVFAVQLPAGAGVVFQLHSAGNAFFTSCAVRAGDDDDRGRNGRGAHGGGLGKPANRLRAYHRRHVLPRRRSGRRRRDVHPLGSGRRRS